MTAHPVRAVDLTKLTDELVDLPEDTTVYVNRLTGEVRLVVDAELSELHGDDGDWVAMPDRSEMHEWQMMTQFAAAIGGGVGEELTRAMHHRRWSRAFKDLIYRHGIEGRWLDFRRAKMEKLAIYALEAANIPYHADQHDQDPA